MAQAVPARPPRQHLWGPDSRLLCLWVIGFRVDSGGMSPSLTSLNGGLYRGLYRGQLFGSFAGYWECRLWLIWDEGCRLQGLGTGVWNSSSAANDGFVVRVFGSFGHSYTGKHFKKHSLRFRTSDEPLERRHFGESV